MNLKSRIIVATNLAIFCGKIVQLGPKYGYFQAAPFPIIVVYGFLHLDNALLVLKLPVRGANHQILKQQYIAIFDLKKVDFA